MQYNIEDFIVHKLKTIIEFNENTPIPLHEPLLGKLEKKYVLKCLDSKFISSVGKYVNQFEEQLKNYTGSKYVVAVMNGTVALQVSIKLVGVKPNDEVLLSPITFVATANAISHCGATPHFVDVNEKNLGLDPYILDDYLKEISITKNKLTFNRFTGNMISAIIPTHVFGHSAEIDKLCEVSKKYNIPLIEDAAEALGSFYKKKHLGTYGELGILSFNGNKIISTGGGGAILTKNRKLAERARSLTTTSKINHKWDYFHKEVAWNYRMPNINAAIGCAQLDKLELILNKKRELSEKYNKAFDDLNSIYMFQEPKNAKSNFWLNALVLQKNDFKLRNKILSKTHNNGFMCRPVWILLNKLPMYTKCPKSNLKTSKNLEGRIICLPSSPNIKLI